MEEKLNITPEELEVFLKNEFPVKPVGRRLIITIDTEAVDGDVILSNNIFSEVQTVLAVGTHVHDIERGDRVLLDLEKMSEMVPSETNQFEKIPRIKMRPIDIGDYTFGLIYDNAVEAVDKRVEDDINFIKLD